MKLLLSLIPLIVFTGVSCPVEIVEMSFSTITPVVIKGGEITTTISIDYAIGGSEKELFLFMGLATSSDTSVVKPVSVEFVQQTEEANWFPDKSNILFSASSPTVFTLGELVRIKWLAKGVGTVELSLPLFEWNSTGIPSVEFETTKLTVEVEE